MATEKEDLLGKLRQWILGGHKKQGDCKIIALVHKDGSDSLMPVETWEIETDEAPDIDGLNEAIWIQAQSDAADSEDRQTYWVLAYFGDARPGTKAYGARQRIDIMGIPKFGDDMSISSSEKMETPKQWVNNMGKMMLEHHRQTLGPQAQLLQHYQKIVDSQARRIAELEKKVSEATIIHERLLSRHHNRQLKLRNVIFWERKKEELGGIVIPMIPTMLAALAGKQLPAAGQTGNGAGGNGEPKVNYVEAFQRFVMKIGPQQEKMDALRKELKQSQMVPIAGLVDAITNGRKVETPVLLAFMQPVDQAQMEAFERILSEDEYEDFVAVHRAMYEEYLENKAKYDKALAEAQADIDNEPIEKPVIRDNEVHEDSFEGEDA